MPLDHPGTRKTSVPPPSSFFSGKGLAYLQRTTQMPPSFCCPLPLSLILKPPFLYLLIQACLKEMTNHASFCSYCGTLSLSLGTKCMTKGGTPASWTWRLSRAWVEFLLRRGFGAQFEQNPSAQGGKAGNQYFRFPSQFFFSFRSSESEERWWREEAPSLQSYWFICIATLITNY